MTVLCREFTISRPTGLSLASALIGKCTFYRICESAADAHNHSPAAHRSPDGATASSPAGGRRAGEAKKLHVLLAEEEIPLSVRTIHRILERHKLISEDSHGPALTRFERSEPNELWQMDTKGKYPLQSGRVPIRCRSWMITAGTAVGLYALSELSGEQAYPCLAETFRRYGIPQAMLMDRGTLWWSAWNGWGLTRLSVRLNRARDSTALWAGAPSADAGKGRTLSRHAGAKP